MRSRLAHGACPYCSFTPFVRFSIRLRFYFQKQSGSLSEVDKDFNLLQCLRRLRLLFQKMNVTEDIPEGTYNGKHCVGLRGSPSLGLSFRVSIRPPCLRPAFPLRCDPGVASQLTRHPFNGIHHILLLALFC